MSGLSLLIAMVLGQYDAGPATVPPLDAWKPAGAGFRARVKEIQAHEKKNNPAGDPRVTTSIFLITARTGTRSWLKRKGWTDGEVHFFVATARDIIDPVVALETAEGRAIKSLSDCVPETKRLLDWSLDDDGVAAALVGCLVSRPEPDSKPNSGSE